MLSLAHWNRKRALMKRWGAMRLHLLSPQRMSASVAVAALWTTTTAETIVEPIKGTGRKGEGCG
jgi:hypothetical protein